jgi:hypothetical protein
MARAVTGLVLVLLVVVLAACGDDSSSPGDGSAAGEPIPGVDPALEFRLETDGTTFPAGSEIAGTVTARNTSAEPVPMPGNTGPDSCAMKVGSDLVPASEPDKEPKIFFTLDCQLLTQQELAPGERLEWPVTVLANKPSGKPLDPGDYLVRAIGLLDGQHVLTTQPVTVTGT